MRRLLSLSLVVIFLANAVGNIGLLIIHRFEMHEHIKKLIRSGKEDRDQVQLRFCPEESDRLIWFDEGHEFRFQGHMYDLIKKVEQDDGSVIFFCIRDDEENKIFRYIFEALEWPSEKSNEDCTLVLQLFKSLSEFVIDPFYDNSIELYESLRDRFVYNEFSLEVYLSINCEPPDIGNLFFNLKTENG